MIIAVDIDHTMSHAAWRDYLIPAAMESGDWEEYHSLNKKDKPAAPIIQLVIALIKAKHKVYIVTARPRKWLRPTVGWLKRAGIDLPLDRILMRPIEDDGFWPSPELKQELLSDLDVDLLIEDRQDVIEAFAKDGVTTLQVRLVS